MAIGARMMNVPVTCAVSISVKPRFLRRRHHRGWREHADATPHGVVVEHGERRAERRRVRAPVFRERRFPAAALAQEHAQQQIVSPRRLDVHRVARLSERLPRGEVGRGHAVPPHQNPRKTGQVDERLDGVANRQAGKLRPHGAILPGWEAGMSAQQREPVVEPEHHAVALPEPVAKLGPDGSSSGACAASHRYTAGTFAGVGSAVRGWSARCRARGTQAPATGATATSTRTADASPRRPASQESMTAALSAARPIIPRCASNTNRVFALSGVNRLKRRAAAPA